jgi:DNA repair exonuclease SbcCD nuclease subunit
MARFLHTSDWQMGLKAVYAGARSKEIRSKRFEAVSRIVDLAKDMNLDFVIIAGDTFEHHDVDEVIVKRTVDILNRFAPIPVYVLPGNHDPWLPGGIWDRQSWNRVGSHITLCTEAKEIKIGELIALYPCPVTQKKSNLDPTSWIPKRSEGDQQIRIGIAHGSLDLIPSVDFPIAKDRAELSGLDYLALGDWHSFFQHGKAVYSGTPEPTNFGEQDAGDVVIVEISKPGESPSLSRCQTRILTWAEFSSTIHDMTDIEVIESSIRKLGPLSSLALRIAPSLETSADEKTLQALGMLQKELEQEVFLLKWDIDPFVVGSPGTTLRLPDGILQRVGEALSAILAGRIPEGQGRTFAGEDPGVVRAAQALLHGFTQGENP